MLEKLSSLTIPAIILILCICFMKDSRLFDSFVTGAHEGLKTTVSILPTLTLLVVALTMFNSSGAADGISALITPLCERMGVPAGIIPLVITRPFSGSASTAAYASLLDKFGADSLEAFIASVIMGSGDTLVYVISVYYSVTRVKKSRYVLPVAIFVSVFAVFFSCILARIFHR